MFSISDAEDTCLHHPTFAAAAGTDKAHQEAIVVGKSLALIGWDMVTDSSMFEAAQRHWQESIQE